VSHVIYGTRRVRYVSSKVRGVRYVSYKVRVLYVARRVRYVSYQVRGVKCVSDKVRVMYVAVLPDNSLQFIVIVREVLAVCHGDCVCWV